MADLRIIDAPEIPTNNITGKEKIPTGGSGNYSITLDSVSDYTKTKKDLADKTYVDGKVSGVREELNTHIEDLLNPHQVTKGQIGLGNVDNTADADKPVSNSTQAAIISAIAPKADKATTLSGYGITDAYTKSKIDTDYGGVKTLYDNNVADGGGVNGWSASLVVDKSGRNLQEKNDDTLQIEDYIAVSATVRDAFINALTVLKSGGGGTLNLGRGKSYNIFTSTTGASTNILDFDRLKNVTINFNGSEIVTDSTVQSVPRIFHLKNPKNITFNDVRVRDLAEQAISGTSPPNHWGAQFLRITVDDTVEEADKGGIVINNIEAKHLDAVFVCDGYNGSAWATKRFKNITINGRVSILNCYYGVVFQNNGDNFTATLNGENIRRLYYPSGVDGHDVVGTIKGNGLAANAGSTGCIFLKSDDVPLTNISAKFKYIGKLSHSNTIALVIQPTTVGIDAQTMENVSVSVDFKEANSDYRPDSIAAFRCYAGGSTTEQTTTNHQFKNITLDINDPSEGTTTLKTNEFVLFGAESTKENTIQFLRSQPKLRLLKKGHVLKNRAMESRFFYGSLNPTTIRIPFDNPYWNTHQLFAKLSVTCINPIGSQRIYREDFYVMGNVTSAGIFQLTNSSKVFTFNSGTAATITLTPNGSGLDVVITGGGGFSDSNCHARIDFELIDATQRRL